MEPKVFDPKNKILHNLDYVKDFFDTGYSAPITIEIDPSNTCNHGCFFCISSYIHLPESKHLETYDKSIMPLNILVSLADDLIKIKTKAINWTGGGEPTVNPSLSEVIKYIKKNSDIKMGMFTNGTLLHKNDLFEITVDSLEWVRISVDSGNSKSYNTIRRTTKANNWNRMVENLQVLIETKKRKKSNIDIGVGFVVTTDNASEIIEFAEFFKDFDLAYCQYKPEIVNRERNSGIQHSIEFFNSIKPKLDIAESILGNKFQINHYKLDDLINDPINYGRTYKKCLGSQVSPCIGADGEVYVCTNHRGYKQYSYGSLYNKSFLEIWSDLNKRKEVMHQIEDIECFANCTKLCKPHESNKILWDLYNTNKDLVNIIKEPVKHPEFI